MAERPINARQRQKYDTSTNWATNNPILLAGEIGVESDTNKIKIGDGITNWNDLAYFGPDTGVTIKVNDIVVDSLSFSSDPQTQIDNLSSIGIAITITDEMLINSMSGILPDEEYQTLIKNNSNTLILNENNIPIVFNFQGSDVDNADRLCYVSINGINKIKRILIAKSISSSSIVDGHLFTIQNLTYMPDVEIWKQIYPIGSVYISVNNTNPETLFGGTWEALPEGYTLFTTTTAGKGGTQIEAGLPNIRGTVSGFAIGSQFDSVPPTEAFTESSKISTGTNTWGSSNGNRARISFDASQSNSVYGKSTTVQPPAIKVYMWRRVS